MQQSKRLISGTQIAIFGPKHLNICAANFRVVYRWLGRSNASPVKSDLFFNVHVWTFQTADVSQI